MLISANHIKIISIKQANVAVIALHVGRNENHLPVSAITAAVNNSIHHCMVDF